MLKVVWRLSLLGGLILSLAGCPSGGGESSSAETSGGSFRDDGSGIPLLYTGPESVTAAEYKFPATQDNEVLSSAPTEVWAKMYRPATLANKVYPVIVFLHGNHATCGSDTSPIVPEGNEYTNDGTCPSGEVVIPNHLGYEYLANQLASFGYIVISVNANRGITDGAPVTGDSGLNLARGRLILRHLALLSQWNQNGTTPASYGQDTVGRIDFSQLQGKIDFSQVGLMGHSRGGEGVRAAYAQYNDSGSIWQQEILSPLGIKAIFEIAPVDGQTSRVLNPTGLAWNVLLSMCDGDVTDLEGMKPFDRSESNAADTVALPKSMMVAWGANHNYYNTQWEISDSAGCSGTGNTPLWNTADQNSTGSIDQQNVASQAVIPFFRAHLGAGADLSQAAIFDFSAPIDSHIKTRIDRTFVLSPTTLNTAHLENFSSSDSTMGSRGVAHVSSFVTVAHTTVPEHTGNSDALMAAQITWPVNGANGNPIFFQDIWTNSNIFIADGEAATLDFRISRAIDTTLNQSNTTDLDVQMIYGDGSLSTPIALSTYTALAGPVGNSDGKLHSTLQTVRIPLSDMITASTQQAHQNIVGVQFTFDKTATGNIYIADINISRYNTDQEAEAAALNYSSNSGNSDNQWNTLANDSGSNNNSTPSPSTTPAQSIAVTPRLNAYTGFGKITRIIPKSESTGSGSNQLQIEVHSDEKLSVRDALPVLRFNGQVVGAGYVKHNDSNTLVFIANRKDIQKINADSFKMAVGYQEDPEGKAWDLGVGAKTDFVVQP